jgi:hypothetical protein
MDQIGVFTPEQARMLWQDYLNRQQLKPQLTKNYPTRRTLDEVSPHRVFVKNTTAETIPPFACMRIIGTEVVGNRTALRVEKPTSTDGQFVFNCEFPIPPVSTGVAGVGWAYRFGIVVMRGDAPSEPNVEYSPIVASWDIEESSGPFTVFGDYEIEGTQFAYTPLLIGRIQSAGGAGESIWFTVDEGPVCDPYGEPYLLVTAERYTGGCGKTPPYAEYGGQYKVYQWCPNDFGPEGSMGGTKGKASLSWPLEGYCEPKWMLDYTCYEPDCP